MKILNVVCPCIKQHAFGIVAPLAPYRKKTFPHVIKKCVYGILCVVRHIIRWDLAAAAATCRVGTDRAI